jgi:hypothetical protein
VKTKKYVFKSSIKPRREKQIMKAFTFAILMFGLATAQTTKEIVVSDSGEKTEEQVIQELQCLTHSKWNDFIQTNMPDLGVQYIRDQLYKGATQNKKYYIQVNETHNVMYFKEGSNYFLHLNEVSDDGSDHMLMRAFIDDKFGDCIRVLPESCKWKGERVVKYIEVCERGMVQAENFGLDIFNVIIDEQEGVFRPEDIIKAIRDCYQPNVYSVAYKCYRDKLYFDPQYAVNYLKEMQAKLEAHGFATKLNLEDFTIDFQKTTVTINGKEVAVDNDWDVQG